MGMNMLPQPDITAQQTQDTQATRLPNLWVRVASSGWKTPPRTPDERERARRSALLAWIILALLVVSVLLIPTGFNAPATLGAAVIILIGSVVAALLNRSGMVTAAGTLLIILIEAAILGAVVAPGPMSLVYLPAYDIFVVAVVVAAAILPPVYAFLTAGLSIALILSDFALQPHSADLTAAVAQFGVASLVTRPIIELIVVSTVTYLLVRGTQDQIRRADRAEEIAQLESIVADQKRALDFGVQELTQAFVRTANGDYNVRVNIPRQNPLWSLGAQMNTFVQRLQQAGQASFELERTRQEAFRLISALDDWRAGRMPLWPAPSGTLLDAIIQRLSGGGGRG
jgi:hypothetical protein